MNYYCPNCAYRHDPKFGGFNKPNFQQTIKRPPYEFQHDHEHHHPYPPYHDNHFIPLPLPIPIPYGGTNYVYSPDIYTQPYPYPQGYPAYPPYPPNPYQSCINNCYAMYGYNEPMYSNCINQCSGYRF